jgi:hypothetical protein
MPRQQALSPPPQLAGDSKIVRQSRPPPPLHTDANLKICQIKKRFSRKVLGRFLIQKYA